MEGEPSDKLEDIKRQLEVQLKPNCCAFWRVEDDIIAANSPFVSQNLEADLWFHCPISSTASFQWSFLEEGGAPLSLTTEAYEGKGSSLKGYFLVPWFPGSY